MITPTRVFGCFFLLLLCGLCFFWRLGDPGIFDQNEGLYTQVAREMYLTSDYVTPRRNGIPWFDKPPLIIWSAAATFEMLGESEFAARLPVAIAATLLVLLTWWFGCRYFSDKAGLIAGAALALNPLFIGTARQMTMDIMQSWWVAFSLACFFLAYQSESKRGKLLYYGFWGGCGLGFLTKSVPGLLPILIALPFVIWNERFSIVDIFKRIWESKPIPGLLFMLLIVAPWHYLVYQANGHAFYEQYFLLHHVKLLQGTDFNHAQPWWYYLPMLLVGFFPWSLFLPWSIPGQDAFEMAQERYAAQRFVRAWALVTLVLFTCMTSKLISYLLPMYAAAALLVGDRIARELDRRDDEYSAGFRASAVVLALLSAAGLIAGMVYWSRLQHHPAQLAKIYEAAPHGVFMFALQSLAIIALGAGLMAALVWTKRRGLGVAVLTCALIGFVLLATEEGLPAYDAGANQPLQELARVAAGKMESDGTPLAIHIARPIRPSILFYLPDKTFEKAPNKQQARDGFIVETGDEAPIEQFLATHRPSLILTDNARAQALKLTTPGLAPEQTKGRWVLLRANPVPHPAEKPAAAPKASGAPGTGA